MDRLEHQSNLHKYNLFGKIEKLDGAYRYRVMTYACINGMIFQTGNVLCKDYNLDLEHDLILVSTADCNLSLKVGAVYEDTGTGEGRE